LKTRVFLGLGAVVCASWAQEPGEPVYQTDFSGASDSAANAPIDCGGEVQSGFTAGSYTAGRGLVRMRLAPRDKNHPSYTDQSWAGLAFVSEAAGTNQIPTLEDAVAADAYIEFRLQSVEPVDFTRIEFSMVGVGSMKTGGVTLRSSADDFAADLGAATGPLNMDYPVAVDLRGLPGLAGRREVTFRFYLYDSFEGHNNRLIGIDDVRVWAEPSRVAAP
jgi:hypothetical protein